jgi:hypothetical protein
VVDTVLPARIAEAVEAALAVRDTEEENRALLKTAKVAAKTAAKKARRAARAVAAAPPPYTTLELDEPSAGAQGVPAAGEGNPALPDNTPELDEPLVEAQGAPAACGGKPALPGAESTGAETAGGGDSAAGWTPSPDNTEGDLVAGAEMARELGEPPTEAKGLGSSRAPPVWLAVHSAGQRGLEWVYEVTVFGDEVRADTHGGVQLC